MKIGTPTANDNDNDDALLDIEGWLKGTTIVPRITSLRQFSHPPLPALPTTNIGVPHAMEHPQ